MTFDKNACPADAMSIKLRHAETNAKLSRTPFNLEQAALTAFTEALDLDGELSAYRTMGNLAHAFAVDKGWTDGHPSDEWQVKRDIAAAVEMLVNAFSIPGTEVARLVVSELRDMELID